MCNRSELYIVRSMDRMSLSPLQPASHVPVRHVWIPSGKKIGVLKTSGIYHPTDFTYSRTIEKDLRRTSGNSGVLTCEYFDRKDIQQALLLKRVCPDLQSSLESHLEPRNLHIVSTERTTDSLVYFEKLTA